jgi:hypothetical protein
MPTTPKTENAEIAENWKKRNGDLQRNLEARVSKE